MIDAFVDTLDIKGLGFSKAKTQITDRKPYHPGDLLKLYLSRAIDDQKLLFHQQAVSDDSPRTARSKEPSDGGQ